MRVHHWIFCLLALPGVAGADLNRLSLTPPGAQVWPRLSITSKTNQLIRLEVSSDLGGWRELGRFHDRAEAYPDLSYATDAARFYRAVIAPRTTADDWRNQVAFPDDALLSPAPGYGQIAPRWVKFALVLNEPDRVYFQDSSKYPFHYDFARVRLGPFKGMSREQFDAATLHATNQQAVLGALLYAPTTNLSEVAIQFAGYDAYPPAQVADWFARVRAVLPLPAGAQVFYFPTFEQAAVTEQNREHFEKRGIMIGSAGRWTLADACYAPGWALGRLVLVPAAEINAWYTDGRLRPTDILMTETVPAEVPPVAGIIALSPATPNSHVAILAQSFEIPFVYFASAAARERLRAWNGQEIVLRAIQQYNGAELMAASLDGQLSEALREELLAFKVPPAIQLKPKAAYGEIARDTGSLRPADVINVGGKASNFGYLRRAVPTNSPSPAIAFTFDLWDAYLDQVLPSAKTLRATLAETLGGYTWPPDMAQLKADLAWVRDQFTDVADFTPEQRTAILAALQQAGFAPERKIRFRSSTNVEDTEQFSGAGLYDSFSGCLADELDLDGNGPCACDPLEARERGVFRAMRKVYASFYNDNAFLERLRHRVDETTVGMAILAHHSTPDEFELANGVATARIYKGSQPDDRSVAYTLVSQVGAVSVANPESNVAPEAVVASIYGAGGAYLDFRSPSSLVPLGDHVLAWETEYQQLAQLLEKAARAYEADFPARKQLTLDFEYKKVAPEGSLRLKQIREVPQPATGKQVTPWLLNQTNRYVLHQGELGDVLGFHRLKSSWTLPTVNARLVSSNLSRTVFGRIEASFLAGLTETNLTAPMADLPNFKHGRDGDLLVDQWTVGAGAQQRTFALHTWLPSLADPAQSPVVFLSDGQIQLSVTYATPQPSLSTFGGGDTTTNDVAYLAPFEPVSALSLLQQRSLTNAGIVIRTQFYWPPPPAGAVAGYTAPVQAWVETRITGLTKEPIVLKGDYAQTYHPCHHNFCEEFVFDPHLEPGLDPAQLAELAARNIRALVVYYAYGDSGTLRFLGMDDKVRYP